MALAVLTNMENMADSYTEVLIDTPQSAESYTGVSLSTGRDLQYFPMKSSTYFAKKNPPKSALCENKE